MHPPDIPPVPFGRRLQHLAPGLLLVALLSFGLIKAVRMAGAELLVLEARSVLNGWSSAAPGAAPMLSDWTALRDLLQSAIELTPGNSEQHRLLGLTYEWRFLLNDSPLVTETDIVAFRQAAIEAYRHSALLRPAWPEGWASLARQKVLLGEEDAELLLALERALALGPNETLVRQMVTDVATLAWTFLASEPALRDEVIRMLEASLMPPQTNDTRVHLSYITTRNMQPELCPLLAMDKLGDWAGAVCGDIEPPAQ